MSSLRRSLGTKILAFVVCVPLLILSACGSTGTSTGNGTPTSKGSITVGSKLDVESQLITKMYTLLLRKAGFTVTEKAALGDSPFVLSAIKSGAIDLYPEFTATGLNALGIKSAYDPQKDYQAVKAGFESQYQITWLDAAPLNDGYAIRTSQSESNSLHITTISQLAPMVSKLILASPSDGIAFIDNLQATYGFTTKSFKQLQKVLYAIGIASVASGQAQLAVCYTTDGTISQKNFIFLQDDKNGFPQFNPAPI